MKSYHLTQEKTVKELCNYALKDFQYEEGVFEGRTFSYKELAHIINAALDQVLGEPVAEAFIDNFGDLKIYPTGIASKALIIARGDSKLYAPKEQS